MPDNSCPDDRTDQLSVDGHLRLLLAQRNLTQTGSRQQLIARLEAIKTSLTLKAVRTIYQPLR